jgi:hypothetical protein
VLVRSVWRADVELGPWEPLFEIARRPGVVADQLALDTHPLALVIRRELLEAGI